MCSWQLRWPHRRASVVRFQDPWMRCRHTPFHLERKQRKMWRLIATIWELRLARGFVLEWTLWPLRIASLLKWQHRGYFLRLMYSSNRIQAGWGQLLEVQLRRLKLTRNTTAPPVKPPAKPLEKPFPAVDSGVTLLAIFCAVDWRRTWRAPDRADGARREVRAAALVAALDAIILWIWMVKEGELGERSIEGWIDLSDEIGWRREEEVN